MRKLLPFALIATLSTAGVGLASERPTEHKGVAVSGQAALPLGEQIPAMEGYEVRIRQVVVEPGGVVKAHAHDTRPGAYYVVRGDGVAEYRADGTKTIVAPGTAVLESKDVDHWIINEGSEAQFFVFDIVPIEN